MTCGGQLRFARGALNIFSAGVLSSTVGLSAPCPPPRPPCQAGGCPRGPHLHRREMRREDMRWAGDGGILGKQWRNFAALLYLLSLMRVQVAPRQSSEECLHLLGCAFTCEQWDVICYIMLFILQLYYIGLYRFCHLYIGIQPLRQLYPMYQALPQPNQQDPISRRPPCD